MERHVIEEVRLRNAMEDKYLEEALLLFPEGTPCRWQKISHHISLCRRLPEIYRHGASEKVEASRLRALSFPKDKMRRHWLEVKAAIRKAQHSRTIWTWIVREVRDDIAHHSSRRQDSARSAFRRRTNIHERRRDWLAVKSAIKKAHESLEMWKTILREVRDDIAHHSSRSQECGRSAISQSPPSATTSHYSH